MRAGLAASTVTPGSTAPPSSRTTPAIVPLDASCAHEIAGTERRSNTARNAAGRGMLFLLARSHKPPRHGDHGSKPSSDSVWFVLPWFVIVKTRVFVYIGAESSDIATRMQRGDVDRRARSAYIPAHDELPNAATL